MSPAQAGILFALLAFAITWIATIPEALRRFHLVTFQVPQWLYAVCLFGPAIAAIIVSIAFERADGLRRLGATFRLRGSLGWYGFALLFPLVTLGMVAGGMAMTGAPLPSRGAWWLAFSQTLWLLPLFLREELGWRGYLLPLLLRTKTPLRATAWTSLAWVVWHIPQYVANASIWHAIIMLIIIAPLSVLFTLVYLRTGSVLPCLAFHSAIDCGSAHLLFFAYRDDYLLALTMWAVLLYLATAAAVRTFFRPKPNQQPEPMAPMGRHGSS